jgi:hypothetical protein
MNKKIENAALENLVVASGVKAGATALVTTTKPSVSTTTSTSVATKVNAVRICW